MASPQIEDGYTKLANELLDAMCKLHLAGNEWMVLHTIIRLTYGWNRKQDWISGSQIARYTGLDRSRVCRALRTLRDKQIVQRYGRQLSIQKDYTRWPIPSIVDENVNNHVDEISNTVDEIDNMNVDEIVNGVDEISNKMLTKSRHTKEKRQYTKDREKESNETPSQVYERVAGKKARKAHAQTMDAQVTDNTLWFGVVYEWLMRGYNDGNVRGMLEWYHNGGPPKAGPDGMVEREQQAADREYRKREEAKLEEWHEKVRLGIIVPR